MEQKVPKEVIMGFDGNEIIKINAEGEIYVKGELIKEDIEVYEGLQEFINLTMESRARVELLRTECTNLSVDRKNFDAKEKKRLKQRKEIQDLFKLYFRAVEKGVIEIDNIKNKDSKKAGEVKDKISKLSVEINKALTMY